MVLENEIMTIIANAGDSRNCSLEAIECAKLGNFEEANKLLKDKFIEEKMILSIVNPK